MLVVPLFLVAGGASGFVRHDHHQGVQRRLYSTTARRMPVVDAPNNRTRLPYAEAIMEGEKIREQRLSELGPPSDMEMIFLGTASCIPSTTRGVSCTALRFQGRTWIFDAGEGSQVQVQRSNNVHPGRIDCIFLTHVHGDHSFGLPGLLCLMGQNRNEDAAPVEIFGPEGLRLYLRTALQLTHSRIAAKYRVHELKNVPNLQQNSLSRGAQRRKLPPNLSADSSFGELPDGKDIFPDDNGIWHLNPPGNVKVMAAAMVHTVPCVGFVAKEPDRPGALDLSKVEHVLNRNYAALKKKGVKQPKKVYKLLKEMKRDQTFTFPDGTKLKAADCVSRPKPGRVVAVCGDTSDASRLKPLLKDRCDIVVHEATNAWLNEYFDKHLDPEEVRRATVAHGHSTPEIAAEFAHAVNAKRLVLNHFSPRYKGDALPTSINIMNKIEGVARKALLHLARNDDDETPEVLAAWDLAIVPIHPPSSDEDDDDSEVSSSSSNDASAPVAAAAPKKKQRKKKVADDEAAATAAAAA